MSRSYGMSLKVKGHRYKKSKAILEAYSDVWDYDVYDVRIYKQDYKDVITVSESRDSLCGGESEDEFVDRAAEAIMKANGGPCKVEITATCYENIPCEIHDRGQEFWDELTS